ncbi:MAG: pantoate--beta-alanine ligase, partial [Bacteroidota bacterium]
PDVMYLGQKDAQQVVVLSKMVADLDFPVDVRVVPTAREKDGLAMSSRNVHLSADDRQHALVLSRTLNYIKDKFNYDDIPALKAEAAQLINAEPGVVLDYFEIADGETLHEASPQSKTIVALVAAKVGKTRLIDNTLLVHS